MSQKIMDCKDADEMQCKEFNIQNDFTPERLAQVRKENEWAVEK